LAQVHLSVGSASAAARVTKVSQIATSKGLSVAIKISRFLGVDKTRGHQR
jgi:hypothetical protein